MAKGKTILVLGGGVGGLVTAPRNPPGASSACTLIGNVAPVEVLGRP